MSTLTPEQLDAVCVELERGCSYRSACTRVGVNLSTLRWHRYGDPKIMRRCNAARATGLMLRADILKHKAAKLIREAERITRPDDYDIV
jgi:hypothetical protein